MTTPLIDLSATAALPRPTTRRFRPLRVGVDGLWEYAPGTRLHLNGGWMHLRGANQSGKSKMIELVAPAAIDGYLHSSRLDPARTMARPMWFNLVGTHLPDGQRTAVGYAFMEFGSIDDDGTERYFTCGYGVKATRGNNGHDSWLFTLTDRRIDDDVDLTPGMIPLSSTGLREAVAGSGSVHTLAEHRRIVARQLYGVTEGRLETLLELILTARTPKLGQRLTPSELSSMLSATLPELDRNLLGSAAEALQGLEDERRRLDSLAEALGHIDGLAHTYTAYLRSEVEHAAGQVRDATALAQRTRTTLEQIVGAAPVDQWRKWARQVRRGGPDADAAREAMQAARTSLPALQSRQRRIDTALARNTERQQRTDAALRQLLQSETYQAQQQLIQAMQDLDGADQRATKVAGRLEDAQRDERRSQTAAQTARDAAAEEAVQLDSPARQLRSAATPLHAVDPADTAVAPLQGDGRFDDDTVQQVRDELAATTGLLWGNHRQLQGARSAVDRAARALDTARGEVDRRAEDCRRAEDGARKAASNVTDEADLWLTAVDTWATGLTQLPADVSDGADPDRPDDLHATVVDAARHIASGLQQQADAAAAAVHDADGRVTELTAELTAVRNVRDPRPDDAPWRRTGPGDTPLYLLVEPTVDVDQLGGVEGALLATGMLTATVAGDGTVTLRDGQLYAVASTPDVTGPTLADVLAPIDDGPVPAATVARLLASVAMADTADAGADGLTVGRDGTFCHGPTYGMHRREVAAYLGTEARRRTRLQRIADLEQQIGAAETALQDAIGVRDRVAGLRRQLDDEVAALPRATDLHTAIGEARQADRAVESANAALQVARDERESAKGKHQLAVGELTATAERLGLRAWADDLDGLADAIRTFDQHAQELTNRAASVAALWAIHDAKADTADRDRARAADVAEQLAELTEDRNRLAGEVDSLRAKVDPDVDLIAHKQRLERMASAYREAAESLIDTRGRTRELLGLRTTQREDATAAADDARRGAAAAADQLRSLHGSDVVAAALADQDVTLPAPDVWSFDTAAALADTVLQAKMSGATTVDGLRLAVTRAGNALANRVTETNDLLQGYRVDVNKHGDEDVQRLTVDVVDGELDLLAFKATVADDLEVGRHRLTDRDRELLEEFLTGDIQRDLVERIVSADEMVRGISEQLEGLATNSGKSVGIRWAPHPEHRDVVAAMLRAATVRNDRDVELLQAFLDERLAEAREIASDPEAPRPLDEVLLELLDYRSWHEFTVLFNDQHDDLGWRRITTRAHEAESGGGKSMLLHLPLLAALTSWYEGAADRAPRMLVLDEVFEGIDDGTQAELLALCVQMDLDVITTAHGKWLCFPQVPQLAVYDVTRDPAEHVVNITGYRWDGSRRVEVGLAHR